MKRDGRRAPPRVRERGQKSSIAKRAKSSSGIRREAKPDRHTPWKIHARSSYAWTAALAFQNSGFRKVIVTNPTLHQAGVIAYRVVDGGIRVLLMTSRDTGRWIIPRGNIKIGTTPAKAAEREAYEEAGIRGEILGSIPLGFYTYCKVLASGEKQPATVEVYLLLVTQQLKKWPEKHERRLSWVSLKKAVRLVQEPGVVPLLRRLMEFEHDLAKSARKPLTQ
ncbi:MAG: NUDIX hydrolase [Stellaceae bacterium]